VDLRSHAKELVKLCGIGRILRKIRAACFFLLRISGNFLGALLMGPRASVDREKIRNILIIRLDRIGDLILSTPAIRATKEIFPYSKLTLVVNAYTKDLVVNNPFVDTLITYSSDGLWQIIRHIRAGKPDLAIVLSPGLMGAGMAYWSRAPYRVGYDSQGAGLFLTHPVRDDREERVRHEVESNLDIMRVIGIDTINKETLVSVTEEGENFARNYFESHGIGKEERLTAIHPGSRQSHIRWSPKGFAKVADILSRRFGMKILILGGQGEQEIIRNVRSHMSTIPLQAEGISLTQLVSLIKRCSLFIGNSTGPMHIAAALQVPVVAIFGCVHPLDSYQEWGPFGSGHTVVSKYLDCPSCHPSDCKTYECMRLISPEEVIEAAEQALRRN
jgi:heptosyltransferase II